MRITNHARQRLMERTKGWMACGRPEDLAQEAWEQGVHDTTDSQAIPDDDGQDPDPVEFKARVYHKGYCYVFADEPDDLSGPVLITAYPVDT